MKKKYYIIISCIIAVNIGTIAFIGFPKTQSIIKSHSDLYAERAKLEQQRLQKADTAKISKQYKQLKEDAEKLNGTFLATDPETILDFVENLEEKAQSLHIQHEITISKIPEQGDKIQQSSSITFKLTGGYVNIYHYIAYLESLPTYLPFSSLTINRANDLDLSVELIADVYWL